MFYLKSAFNLNAYKNGMVFGVIGISTLFSISCYADDNWTLNLKNAYIERNFDNRAVKDFGSWSQSASLFYKSDYYPTPIENLDIGVDGTVQYAVRLSHDRGVADTVLPFDNEEKKQASDF